MTEKQPNLSIIAFEAFGKQVINGAGLCSDQQILALADSLHDIIRHRRNRRFEQSSRSFDPASIEHMMAAGRS